MRLVNKSKMEAAVRLSIDGLNVFTFCDEKHPDKLSDGKLNPLRKYRFSTYYRAGWRQASSAPGWIISRSKVLGFKRVQPPPSTASPTRAVHRRAQHGDVLIRHGRRAPEGEPPTTRGPGDDGTGLGKPEEGPKPVERQVGKVRGSVSVRYSSAK